MKLILLALAVAQASPAPQRQWETIYDANGEQLEVDAASLHRDGDLVHAWVRGRPTVEPDSPLRTLIIQAVYDCRRSTEITLSLEGFDENGQSLGLVEVPENERNPQTMGDGNDPQEHAIMRRVCANDGGATA